VYLFGFNTIAAHWKQRAAQQQYHGHNKQYNAARGVGAERTGVEFIVGCFESWSFPPGKTMRKP